MINGNPVEYLRLLILDSPAARPRIRVYTPPSLKTFVLLYDQSCLFVGFVTNFSK